MKALGLIEVYGLVTAIEALDAAVKAANVTLLGLTKVQGGRVCIQVTGDVGATRAAIDAASAAAAKVGKVVAVHVIPRPADPVAEMLARPGKGQGGGQGKGQDNGQRISDKDEELVQNTAPFSQEPAEQPAKPVEDVEPAPDQPSDDLNHLTVSQLRTMAREIGVTSLSRRDIRFAKKEELLEAIRQFHEQGS